MLVLAITGLTVPPAPAKAAGPEPIRYSYDDGGRLTGVNDTAGAGARYSYDKTGNLTGVTRHSAAQVTVLGVSPSRGAAGAEVTITGTGFAATTASNTVTFNGVAATVTAAGPTRLTATVPAGATTGTVQVTVAGTSASLPRPFTVESLPVPAITGFSPTSGVPGDTVTISGTGFDPDKARDVVEFNGIRARVTAATATSLTAVVPGTSSGRIAVRTPGGVATSAARFATAPGPFALGKIVSTTDLTINGPAQAATVGTSGKVALLRFDGTKGQRISLVFTGNTFGGAIDVRLFTATNTELSDNQYTAAYRPNGDTSFSLPTLPDTGTYQVVVDPGSRTGAINARVVADVDGGALSESAGTSATISQAGQRVRFTFKGIAGRPYSVGVTGSTGTGANQVTVYRPDGAVSVGSASFTSGNGVLATGALPATGDYVVVIHSPALITRSFTVTLAGPVDFGVLSLTGAGTVVTTTLAGQTARLRLDATAGDLRSLALTGSTYGTSGTVTVTQPGGARLGSYSFSTSASEIDLPRLPETGSYDVLITPGGTSTGSLTVTLAADVQAGTLDPTAAGVTATTNRPGQNARLTFDGTVGQRTSLAFTGSTYGGSFSVSVYRPDGTVAVDQTFSSDSHIDLAPLTVAGTHQVIIDPGAPRTGAVIVTLSREFDGGVLSPTAAGTAVSITRPGQNAGFRFDGATGQRVSFGFSGSTFTSAYYLTVLRPDGTTFVNDAYLSGGNTDYDLVPLPVSGTYTAFVDYGIKTGSMTVTYSVLLDGGVLSSTGAGTAVSITRP
ncbi:IPT/TIG domain-containing protein, partial [Micromonospora sp. NPDC005203]|uniref:IPT/TIG domain-containing protein n=1 Tax=Micromonospora sp. NPDC005203 TaxID=3364226 RepID=UPI0036B82F42